MSVTQDYKVLTLTAGEHAAVRNALIQRGHTLHRQIDFFTPLGTHTSLVSEFRAELAGVQSALAKVRA